MNPLVVSLVVILLPGIIAAVICDKITRHSQWGWFKFTLYAVVLGWLSYLTLQVVSFVDISFAELSVTLALKFEPLAIWAALLNGKGEDGYNIPYAEIIGSSFCSIPVALVASVIINYKVINKIAQFLRISTKYGDENLFSYYLNLDEVQWVYVRDKANNFTFKGQIVMHSETKDIQELVLADVDVYLYEDSAYLYSTPSMYFCKKVGEFVIEAATDNTEGASNE